MVPTGTVICYAQALLALRAPAASDLYWSARALFVHRPEEVAAFDEAFTAAVEGTAPTEVSVDTVAEIVERTVADADEIGDTVPPAMALARYSRAEQLADKDFSACTEEELRETRDLLDRAVLVAPLRRSRRLVRTRRRGARPDVRRSIAACVPAVSSWRSGVSSDGVNGAGSSFCSTSRDRWTRIHASSCDSCMSVSPRAARSRRSRSARG
jgi:uncharacterized protein with von Willebrand factor type A (vWA) domain